MSRFSPLRKVAHLTIGVMAAALIAGTATPAAAATESASDCTVRVGTSLNGGHKINNATPRWQYSGSLYLGARWNSCDGTITVYYGEVLRGYTHLNLRVNGEQRELQAVPGKRQYTISDARFSPGTHHIVIQDCVRGGTFQRSTCDRWSPTIALQVHA